VPCTRLVFELLKHTRSLEARAHHAPGQKGRQNGRRSGARQAMPFMKPLDMSRANSLIQDGEPFVSPDGGARHYKSPAILRTCFGAPQLCRIQGKLSM